MSLGNPTRAFEDVVKRGSFSPKDASACAVGGELEEGYNEGLVAHHVGTNNCVIAGDDKRAGCFYVAGGIDRRGWVARHSSNNLACGRVFPDTGAWIRELEGR